MPKKNGDRKKNEWAVSDHVRGAIDLLKDLLPDELQEMRDMYDNRSDRWQESEKGQALMEWLEALEQVKDEIENAELDAPDVE